MAKFSAQFTEVKKWAQSSDNDGIASCTDAGAAILTCGKQFWTVITWTIGLEGSSFCPMLAIIGWIKIRHTPKFNIGAENIQPMFSVCSQNRLLNAMCLGHLGYIPTTHEVKTMKKSIRQWWRKLRNRCLSCGGEENRTPGLRLLHAGTAVVPPMQ